MTLGRLLSSVSVLALSTGAALAADVAVKAPVHKATVVTPLPYTWTGFYVGGNVGYLRGHDFAIDTSVGGFTSSSPLTMNYTGTIAGGQAGYNFQSGFLVAGIEADIDAGFGGGGSTSFNTFFGSDQAVYNTKISSVATIRGRAGLAFDRVFLYATGGLGWARLHNDIHLMSNRLNFTESSWRQGYVWGGGIEFALNNNWSVKAEALKLDLPVRRVSDPTSRGYSFDFDDSAIIIRGGINYKF